MGNQQLTLTVSGPAGSSSTAQTCHAPGSTISVRMTRKTLPHGAKLTLRYVTFALGKQLKRVNRLPATVKLSLRGLRAGTNTLTVRAVLQRDARRQRQRAQAPQADVDDQQDAEDAHHRLLSAR